MKFKRVFFAGYFCRHKDKLNFTRLFNAEKRVFLESSEKFIKTESEQVKYFPMSLFHLQGYKIWNILFNRVDVDAYFVDLYRRDLKVFKLSYMEEKLPPGWRSKALFIYWLIMGVYKQGFSVAKVLGVFRAIRNRRNEYDEHGIPVGNSSYLDKRALKLLAFRLAFINGFIYTNKLIRGLDIGSDDLVVLWGSHNSGPRFFIDYLNKQGICSFISEYGELPGTFSLNKDGIFGDSKVAKDWAEIRGKESDVISMANTKEYLERVEKSQSSSRGNSIEDQMLLFYRELFQPKELVKKVIYVSGVELVASGHLFNKELISPEEPNVNELLLKQVVSKFSADEYIIFYKDHPLMQNDYPSLALSPSDFNSVVFLNTMSADNLVSMADITVTLPSKVIMTCLLYNKPVYVYGEFSIPESAPELGYYTGHNISDIKEILNAHSVDEEAYPKLVDTLLDDYLIRVDSPLFDRYNFKVEKEKLGRLISNQLDSGK